MATVTPIKILHSMTGAPTGDLIDLGDWYNEVTLTARGACNVRFVLQAPGSSAPSAPVATPVPAAGSAASGWNDMVADDVDSFDPDPSGQKKYRYGEIWEKAAAVLVIGAR
jgi:hypothetical protein